MTNISEQQSEQLSAYLDGALPDHERIAVEQQLHNDPALAAELRELQTTIAMVRDLPAVQPPRTFTLDPAQYGRRRGLGFRWMRWAALVGAVVLMLTVGLSLAQLSQGGVNAPAPVASSAGSAAQLAEAPTTAVAAQESRSSAAAATSAPAAAPPQGADNAAGALPPLDSTTMKSAEATTTPDMLAFQAVPDTALPADPTGDSPLSATGSLTLPVAPMAGGNVAAPTLQITPDAEQLDLPVPEQPANRDDSSVVPAAQPDDNAPSLWLLFLLMVVLGIVGAVIVTRLLRHTE